MNLRGRAVSMLVAGTIWAALSCGTEPLRPEAPPDAGLVNRLTDGLLRCTPLPADSTTQTIGPPGGVVEVGPHRLSVPAGALAVPVAITAVAPTDEVNRVRLLPEGLTFDQPAGLTLSYANCSTLGILLPKRVAYVDDALTILEYVVSLDDRASLEVTGRLDHFSSYAVAW